MNEKLIEKLNSYIDENRDNIVNDLIAVSSIGNLVFRLPDSLQLLDELGGALVGFVKGFLYCVLLCWLLSFLGLVIGKDTLENTLLARFFLTFRFLTNGLL